jgi:deleted-in-malignant-brain-tumors protein 1
MFRPFFIGTGNILFDNTACTGSEPYMLECPRITPHNCGHTEDAGVICQPHVRLAGSNNHHEGRVEVYKDGSWGTVCDWNWDIAESEVVCRMLGFNGAVWARGEAYYGEGTGTIHYDGLLCNGNEKRLLHCHKSPIGTCTHAQDAGVRCQAMRLVGGPDRNKGRVEMRKNGTWGTICDPDFPSIDALQIAHDLGRSSISGYYNSPIYGTGSGDIKISNITCGAWPLKDSIFDCHHSEGDEGCTHEHDISLWMNAGVRVYTNGYEMNGEVGVYREGMWSRVCANDWDIRDAHVVCRESRYPGAVEAIKIPRVDDSTPVIRGGYRCEGYEVNLEDCERGSVPSTCTHNAGVTCQTLRLVDGPSPHFGRLEVFRSGAFGGICDESWDIRDAHVACVQLGFLAGARATQLAPADKVKTSGLMWMTEVYCNGLEKNIFDCKPTMESCSASNAVWVECIP